MNLVNLGFFVFLFSLISLLVLRFYYSSLLSGIGVTTTFARPPGTSRIELESPRKSIGSTSEKTQLTYEEIQYSQELFKSRQEQKLEYVRIFISFLVLSSALFIVLNDSYSDPAQKWAFGAIGTILGYWLKN